MKKMLRGSRRQDENLAEGSKFCGVAAAMIGSAVVGGAASAYSANKNAKAAEAGATQQNKLDPRYENILFGGTDGASSPGGLLSQFQGYLGKPQDASLQAYGNANLDYLKNNGAGDLSAIRGTAGTLMSGAAQAPQANAISAPAARAGAASMSLPAYAAGNMVKAPTQNNIDLTSSYQNLLSGGDTTALTNSLKAGNDLAGAQFKQNQSDMTDNLQRNIMPGIRSNSVLAGQYGGSRQGIAEGNAISDFTKQLNNSNTQFGLGATAASSAAMAGSYENGQNRALSATQGLGAQQYGVAQQDAATKNAAEFMNVGNALDVEKTNATFGQQTGLANLGVAQQTNMANQNAYNTAGLANQSATLQTNAQNNGAMATGAGLLGGLNSQAYGVGTNQDSFGLNQAGKVGGLLAPFMSANSSSSSTQPLYQNTAGNVLGGALAGGQLASMFGGMFNGKSNIGPGSTAGTWNNGYANVPIGS